MFARSHVIVLTFSTLSLWANCKETDTNSAKVFLFDHMPGLNKDQVKSNAIAMFDTVPSSAAIDIFLLFQDPDATINFESNSNIEESKSALQPTSQGTDHKLMKNDKTVLQDILRQQDNVYQIKSRTKRSSTTDVDLAKITHNGKTMDKDALVPHSGDMKSFRHGFSTLFVSSLDDTNFDPIPGPNNYLYIKLMSNEIELKSVKLLDLNYALLLDIPLELKDAKEKLYITELFDPPSQFRIAVKGVDEKSKNVTMIFGPLVPESDIFFINVKPTIIIEGDDKVTVRHHGKLELLCIVDAYPAPDIFKWKDPDGRTLPSKFNRVSSYKYQRSLKLNHIYKSGFYECYAKNKKGDDKNGVKVLVEPKPFKRMIRKPKNETFKHNAEGVLQCEVESYPPARISWIYNNALKPEDIVISPDNSTLIIKHTDSRARGKYGCKVEHGRKSEVYYANINITPSVPNREDLKIFSREGETVNLTCNLPEGHGRLDIRWRRKLKGSSDIIELKKARNQASYPIVHAKVSDTGVYTCAAARKGEPMIRRIIKLSVESKPTVELNITGLVVVKNNTEVNVKCAVDGEPTPKVGWLKDGVTLKEDRENGVEIFRDHSLRLKTNMHHTGNYTCRAENKLGIVNKSVNITVYYLDVTAPWDTHYEIERDKDVYLPCRDLVKGISMPTLNWIFFSLDGTAQMLSHDKLDKRTTSNIHIMENGDLNIIGIQPSQRGSYTCVARNIGGQMNITFNVDVLVPPEIPTLTNYSAVEGDRLLIIHCNATGYPEPEIIWETKGFKVAKVPGIIHYEKNWLRIHNILQTDTGVYTCLAKNTIAKVERIVYGDVHITVYGYPPPESIKKTIKMLVEHGSRKLIDCPVFHTRFDTIRWYKDMKILHGHQLEFHSASLSNSGVYTCRVSKASSVTETANINVVVGPKPAFMTEPPTDVKMFTGLNISLDCRVFAGPVTWVKWWHNGKYISFSETLYDFRMASGTAGKYTCEVFNDFGSVVRMFNVALIVPHTKHGRRHGHHSARHHRS